jgi:hypothetical protein
LRSASFLGSRPCSAIGSANNLLRSGKGNLVSGYGIIGKPSARNAGAATTHCHGTVNLESLAGADMEANTGAGAIVFEDGIEVIPIVIIFGTPGVS